MGSEPIAIERISLTTQYLTTECELILHDPRTGLAKVGVKAKENRRSK